MWAGSTLLFPLLTGMALTGGVLSGAVWLSHKSKRHTAPRTHAAPDLGATHVPYGIAISFGAALVGLHLLNG